MESENEEPTLQELVEAIPLGEMIRSSGKGRGKKKYFGSFEYDSIHYELEDSVLIIPQDGDQKPYSAIIKDIYQFNKTLMVTGQQFYRLEEAEKRGGGNWQSHGPRELFYSFHRDEVLAESVLHKCVVHFIPLNKPIPHRKQHPGFIVQRVYDTEQRRLFKLTDNDYGDDKQEEIDVLVQKTLARLGDLSDIEPEDVNMDHKDYIKTKRLSRVLEGLDRSQTLKPDCPGCPGATSKYFAILLDFKVLTNESQCDKWLEKLLQSIEFKCSSPGSNRNDVKERCGSKNNSLNEGNRSPDKDRLSFDWPDAAVPAVTALEKATHDYFSGDFQKYNQKMRQLTFNLKSKVLARRLLNRELEPAQILNVSPKELKEGLTAEEIAIKEPEDSGRMQMTNARCKRCLEKRAGLKDIIRTGLGERYQLECEHCGNTWTASR